MAGDWIKMRTDLYRDPKVCLMADFLLAADGDLNRYVSQNKQRDMSVTRNVMRNAVVGSLVTVWGVARLRGKRHGNDLHIPGATVSVIDDIADLPGFGEAMESVGWVEQHTKSLVFPNFYEEYNTDPTVDQRAANAERQRRYREKRNAESNALRDVTVASQSNAREEKRREESSKEEKPPLPPADGGSRVAPTKRKTDPEADPLFARFWTAYPRKTAKPKAAVAFARLKPDEHLLARMLEAIGRQSQTEQWLRDGGQYIPHPATWIHGRRWEDMIQPTTGPPATFDPEAGARETRRRMELLRTQEPEIPNPEAKR